MRPGRELKKRVDSDPKAPYFVCRFAIQFLRYYWYSPNAESKYIRKWRAHIDMDLRILIVDDSVSMRRIIATIVGSHSGWEICGEAESGLSGIEKFEELRPDLVLLDFGMPDINGIEAASRMSTANPTVPLILFTVWDLEGLERIAAKAGIWAVVLKSEAWKLIAQIETVFAQRSKQRIQ